MSRRGRKRKVEEEVVPQINDADQDNFFPDETRAEMETMWQIPQISHFLHLTRESLSIPQLSMYEMERMLSMPRASKQLANIMTCLLSSPITKAKLRKIPPMPYEFWTNILAHKMNSWFKIYHAKHKDATKVLEIIGVEPEFWNLFPDISLLNGKDFEDLTFKQRVWLLKTVCDTIMHTRKTVQEDIAKQPWEDQFETVLGIDRYGARYVYFPQFIPNDLRIYRHSLDNKILSTVKSAKSNQETETIKLINARLNRYKQKTSQPHNNNSCHRRSSRRNCKIENKNSYKCNNDSTASSFISEDTNLSCTSTNSNNNNISLDALKRKRSRSLSKTSDESTLSNARSSSGYDTNTSADNKSVCVSSQMFKGFANVQNDNCKIEIINEILDDLKSEMKEEKNTNEYRSNNNRESQENFVESYKTGSRNEILVVERSENEKLGDNLSSRSKTDDEKLNEIISAESCKLSEDAYLKSVCNSDNVSDISTSTSKSDDEKLSETKTSDIRMNKDNLNEIVTPDKLYRASSSDSEKVTKRKGFREASALPIESKLKELIPERNLRKRTKLRSRYRAAQHNEEGKPEAEEDNKTNEVDKKNLSEMRLQEDMEDNLDDTNSSDYNLQETKDSKTEEDKRHFNKMLSDLGVSEFQLVVDTVGGLRDLITSFVNSRNNKVTNSAEVYPPCEVVLVEKLTNLLNLLEPMETTLKDSTRKAKTKLQREWSNFKEGSVEDQDSSGEGGLSSNWWVLGSQGRDPLSTTGDATLQALPQPALSPFGTQNTQQQAQSVNSEHENTSKNCSEQSRNESPETSDKRQDRNEEKQPDIEMPSGGNEVEDKREKQEHQANEDMSSDKDEEQQTRRVLRARGISSYTEQLYSDYETEEDELEEWTDVEAVYAAPGAQADTSTSHVTPKDRHADDWSDEEDSDQDWILPGSRKRKNKRPSANRRLKSFQHKLHNITENTNDTGCNVSQSANAKIVKDKFKVKFQNNKEVGKAQRIDSTQISDNIIAPATSEKNSKEALSSTNAICNIESINSVHSELDIKDEGPIYELNPANNYVQSNYNSANPQQNYYYVISQNPAIAGGSIIPQGSAPLMQTVQGVTPLPIQHGYYVQPGSQQNYVIQNPTFLPATQQQPVFQQQGGLQIVSTDVNTTTTYMNNNSYVSYVAHNPQNPIHPRAQNRYAGQNNSAPRPILPYPNGAVIRSSSAPIRGGRQRSTNQLPARDNALQQSVLPNSKAAVRQKKATQMSSAESSSLKTTSLIVISDSDDEIEMIITEKSPASAQKATETNRVRPASADQSRQKPTITSDITVTSGKSVIPPQIIQRMNQGGISITPVKNTPPPQSTNSNTQLVVVVNDTGSHYALALPNGSKLILTPEQVAQIRASNGGKLIL